MKKIFTFAIVSLTSLSVFSFEPNLNNGENIFKNQCVACHDENAVGMATPVLHGQYANYLTAELMNFKNDRRRDLMMGAMPYMAKALSDSDIVDVANYLAKQDVCKIPVPVDPQGGNVAEGKIKVEQNACLGCHRVNNPYGAPRLDGQKNQYISHSLKIFKSKDRTGTFMNTLTMNLKETDFANIAAYMNSLRKCK